MMQSIYLVESTVIDIFSFKDGSETVSHCNNLQRALSTSSNNSLVQTSPTALHIFCFNHQNIDIIWFSGGFFPYAKFIYLSMDSHYTT